MRYAVVEKEGRYCLMTSNVPGEQDTWANIRAMPEVKLVYEAIIRRNSPLDARMADYLLREEIKHANKFGEKLGARQLEQMLKSHRLV